MAYQDTLEIRVQVTRDPDYGTVYVATNEAIGLVTDGRTFEELLARLREALALCLEDPEELEALHIVPDPRVVLTMEMPQDAPTA